jgi:hypothetical protein
MAVAGRSLLIVYIERAATAVAFSRAIGGRPFAFHRLAADGAGWRMQDRETGSLWNAVTGEALGGPLEGSGLTPLPATQAFLASWRVLYPRGAAVRAQGAPGLGAGQPGDPRPPRE